MLLWSSQNRSHWRAPGDGLLPLSVMPFLVWRTGQCLLPLEARGREGHGWSGAPRNLRQDAHERAPILPEMRWASDGQSSAAEHGRCVRGDHPIIDIRAGRSCQLRGDGAANERWSDKIQRLPVGVRRIGQNAFRVTPRCAHGPRSKFTYALVTGLGYAHARLWAPWCAKSEVPA